MFNQAVPLMDYGQQAPQVSGREISPSGGMAGGMGGPLITGKWYNKLTGDFVIVRDTIIDGNTAMVITNKGQIPMNEFSNLYIQGEETGFENYSKGVNVSLQNTSSQNLISIKDNGTMPTYTRPDDLIVDDLVAKKTTNSKPLTKVKETIKKTNNQDIIEPVLIDNLPKMKVSIEWDDMPKDGLTALFKYFKVSHDDVIDFIFNKITVDKEVFKRELKQFLGEEDKYILLEEHNEED